jgi:predicted dehydrogenase
VQELQEMKNLADSRNVKVYLGYNKNVTPYIQKALALTWTVPNSHVFFCHCNSYTRAELPECFTRNSEGILKNMAIHELALLVSFFDVTVDNIEKFKVNTSKLFSEKLKVRRPGTQRFIADFSRVTFTVTNKKGTHVSVMADRCGGNVSFAVVKDENGQDVQKFEFPDPETAAKVEEQVKADPEMMPYFFVQGDDYLELKNRVIDSTLSGSDAPGVATIQVGIEALKLAEYGTEELNKVLEA